MKLTLRPEWRPRPLNSFLGFVDLKLGVSIVLLFALFNKVAGVYGLIAVFTGGSFAQVSLYIYSVLTLVAFGWALKAISEEDPRRTLYFAHLFFADHVLSTAWTVFFALVWWVYNPHDGQRQANSPAQEQLMHGHGGHEMTDSERAEAAMAIWNKEKGLAAALIVVGWLAKLYFALLIYSYAIHLRRGSYRSLPCTNTSALASSNNYAPLDSSNRYSRFPNSVFGNEDDDDLVDDHYQVPVSATSHSHARGHSAGGNGSISSFADFINAPGKGGNRRVRSPLPGGSSPRFGGFSTNGTSGSGLGSNSNINKSGVASSSGGVGEKDTDFEDEVLFDSDELRNHSRLGTTEESTSVSSRDDERDTSEVVSGGGRYTPSLTKERPRSGYSKNSLS